MLEFAAGTFFMERLMETQYDRNNSDSLVAANDCSDKGEDYEDLEIEILKSTRDNFLVWKDFDQ